MKPTLTVNLATDSFLLRSSLPIEIRDSRLRLAGTLRGSGSLPLDPGTYRVSAVLGDGREYAEIVSLGEGADASLTLGEYVAEDVERGQTPALPASVEERDVDWPNLEGFGVRQRMARKDPLADRLSGKPGRNAAMPWPPGRWLAHLQAPLVLSTCDGAIEHASKRDEWGFRATDREIGVAKFRGRDACWRVSLPVFVGRYAESMLYLDPSTAHRGDAPDCVVKLDTLQDEVRPLALIAPWRTVASAMQHMLIERQLTHAANVAEAASDLLLYKYQDPVAAALGALVLHRIGRLGEHSVWVDNLARDFPWLPDGRILKAALLSAKADDAARDEAVELLLSCVDTRVLFTDSYSLLLELLRRHQAKPSHATRCGEALEHLAAVWPQVEWDLPTFTVCEPRS